MNRVRAVFADGESGTDGFGISAEQSVADLDADAAEVVDGPADGDVCLKFRSADDGPRAELEVYLDEAHVRALAADLDELLATKHSRTYGVAETTD